MWPRYLRSVVGPAPQGRPRPRWRGPPPPECLPRPHPTGPSGGSVHGSDLEESSDHVSEYAALSEVHSSVYWKTILNMSFPSFCNGTPPRGVSAPWPAMAAPNSGPPPGPRACPVLPEAPLLLRGRPHGQVCRERSSAGPGAQGPLVSAPSAWAAFLPGGARVSACVRAAWS